MASSTSSHQPKHLTGAVSPAVACQRIAEALTAADTRLAGVVTAEVRRALAAYAQVPRDEVEEAIRSDLVSLAGRLAATPHGNHQLGGEPLASALRRAGRGIGLETVLTAHRVLRRSVWSWIEREARAWGLDADALLAASHAVAEWYDDLTGEAAREHRREERRLARRDRRHRAEFVQRLLHGTLSGQELLDRAATYDLHVADRYRAFRARCWDEHSRKRLEARLLTTGGGSNAGVLVATLGADLAGVLPAMPDLPRRLDVICAVGPAVDLRLVDASFRTACRVMAAAQSFELRGLVTLAHLGPRIAVATEIELGEELQHRFVAPLSEMGPFGEELATTLSAYLRQGLRIEATAEALHVHANTVRHRLQRFEEVTGADTRSFEQLVEVWWALERTRLRPARPGTPAVDPPVGRIGLEIAPTPSGSGSEERSLARASGA